MSNVALNMVGPATFSTGYGIHFVNLALALNKRFEVSMTPRSALDPKLAPNPMVKAMCDTEFNYKAPTICVWFADCMQLFTGATRIGFPVFESNLLTKKQVYHITELDHLLVTSKWAEEVVEVSAQNYDLEGLLPNVSVVHEGFDAGVFQPKDVKENYMTLGWKRPYIQNVGKWEERKGHPELIKVMGELADEGFEFTFVGMWNNKFQANWREHANHYLAMHGFFQRTPGVYEKGNVTVVLPDPMETSHDLANLMSICDFGVYPFKSEGWCLPLLETMACAKPVIATNYSAPTEYLIDAAGILLPPRAFEPVYDNVFFRDAIGEWAKVSHDDLKNAMVRMIQMGKAERFAMGAVAAERASHFTWDDSADKVITCLGENAFI